jgi:hypothetical protein
VFSGSLALMLAGLAAPFLTGSIGRNQSCGFRTAKTLSDPSLWVEANKVAAEMQLMCAAFLACSAVAIPLWAQRKGWSPIRVVVVSLLCGVGSLVMLLIVLVGYNARL